MRYFLFTTYYLAEDKERNQENHICLTKNIENSNIERIYLFLQTSEDIKLPLTHQKLHIVKHGKRPSFSDFFNYTNQILEKEKNVNCIIANSDIYFDNSLRLLDTINLADNKIVTLTRWDLQHDNTLKFYNKYLSQDAWIYSTKITTSIGNYPIGQHGCDNRLLFELHQEGFKIINPSLSVISVHVHMSQLRPYFQDPNYQYVSPPYKYIFPSGIVHPINLPFLFLFNRPYYNLVKFNLSDYYYIRFEYYLKASQNTLQRTNLPYYKRLISNAIYPFYYVLFKFFKLINQ